MQFNIGKNAFDLPELAGDSAPRLFFLAALDAANSYATAKSEISADAHLSSTGKAAKLAPLADRLWQQIFVSVENIANERAHWDKREAALLDVGAPQSANEIARDQEIRAWWRHAAPEARQKIMNDVQTGPEHVEMVRAILRSPVPDSMDVEKRYFREQHDRLRRLDNAGEAVAIDSGRDAVNWANHGLQHVVGISHGMTERPADVVLRFALKTGHEQAAVEMFDAARIAHAKHIIAAERRQVAA